MVERCAQFDPRSGEVVGFRAVAAWRSKRGEIVTGEGLWSLAEESGVDSELSKRVLQRVATKDRGSEVPGRGLDVSVRLPGSLLAEADVVEQLTGIAGGNGLAVGRVILEVSEDQVLADLVFNARRLSELREAGFSVGLIGYGTGTASITLLGRLAFDFVTLDRDLCRRCSTDGRSDLVSALIAVVRATGARVVGVDVDGDGVLEFDRVEGLAIDLAEHASAQEIDLEVRRDGRRDPQLYL